MTESVELTSEEVQIAAAKNYVQRLREVAEFYEANPTIKLPFDGLTGEGFGIYGASKEEVIAGAKAFGHADKKFDGDVVMVSKTFPSGIKLYFYAKREIVCERVVTGQKVLPAVTIPAKEEQYIPEQVIDEVEWVCGSLLGAA